MKIDPMACSAWRHGGRAGALVSIMLVSLRALSVQAAAHGEAVAGPVGPWVAGAVRAGGLSVGTLPEGSLLSRDTWASWTTGDPGRWRVHLVLLHRTGRAVRVVWGVVRRDGYAPVLREMGWEVAGHFVLMLQFQYGAAYTRAEFYVLKPDGKPRMLDSVEGSLIERIEGGAPRLKAYDTADLQGAPRCYGWDGQANRLAKVDC